MKKYFVIFLIIFGVFLLVYLSTKNKNLNLTPSVEKQHASDKITSPFSGQIWEKGKTYIITWTGGKKGEALFLIDTALEKQGVSVSLTDRVYNISNNSSYSYTVPENIPDGVYKIQIAGLTSEEFTISSN